MVDLQWYSEARPKDRPAVNPDRIKRGYSKQHAKVYVVLQLNLRPKVGFLDCRQHSKGMVLHHCHVVTSLDKALYDNSMFGDFEQAANSVDKNLKKSTIKMIESLETPKPVRIKQKVHIASKIERIIQ